MPVRLGRLSGARRNSFAFPRIERPRMSPRTGLDLLCATPTPQDEFGTTSKYNPFTFTMSRTWKHTAGQDTDDEGEKDPLTPPRIPRASHQQPRRLRHGGSDHHIVAMQSMRAQPKTLDNANSGPRSPLRNAMQSIDETPSTSATADTAADTHPPPPCSPPALSRRPPTRPTRGPVPEPLHRAASGVGRTAEDKHHRRQGDQTHPPRPHAGLVRTAEDTRNRPQGGAAPPPKLQAGLMNRADDQLSRRHGGTNPHPQPRADVVRSGDDHLWRRHGGPEHHQQPRASVARRADDKHRDQEGGPDTPALPHSGLSRAANVRRGRLHRGAGATPQHRAESRRNADVIDATDEAATYPQQLAAPTMDATPPTLDAADAWPKLGAFITKGSFVYFLIMLSCTFSNRVMKQTKRKQNNRQLACRSQRKEFAATLPTAALPRTVRVTVGTACHREQSVW